MDYMTLKEAAEKWGVTPRRVNYYCAAGRIPGAVKMAGGEDAVGKAVRQGVNDRISLCLRPGGAGQREKQNHQKQGMSH